MKFKIVLFLSVFFLLMLFYSCANVGSTPDGEKSDGDLNLYLITTNGSLNSLSQNAVDAEYNTFFFLPGETRKIYLGGKLPTDHSNYNVLWLENSSIWNPRHTEGIYSSDINDNNYYGIPIGLSDIPAQSGDYNVYAKVGFESGVAYTPYSTKNLTFKVSPNYDDRDWGLRVYQQQSYNVLNLTKDEIVNAFNNMHVYLAPLGNENIIDVNNSLEDEIYDLEYNGTSVVDDNFVIYAMNKIYPSLTVTEAINTYAQEHPNEGLLFFVKDYNPINFPPNEVWLGYTISNAYANGVKKQAPISFIFVKRIKDLFSDGVENQVIKYVTIHELGHLWCEGFTDQASHTLWHNGDNQNICLMKAGIGYPTPTQEDEKILNNLVFCEGHLQRGMNVSWHLKQYSPYGEQTTQQNQIILASNKNFNYLQDRDLEIEISCDKPEIIQGEYIDILVKVINKTNKTITMGAPKNYLYDYNNSSTYTNQYGAGRVRIEIPPNGVYYFFVDPQSSLLFKDKDFSTNSFPPGSYDYYLSLYVEGKEVRSNKINLKVEPVPDSLKQAYEDLRFDPKTYDPNKNYLLEAEEKFRKYKGTYYEREFYYGLLQRPEYRDDKSGLKADLFKNFILKYPNSVAAYYMIQKVLDSKNDSLAEDIITHLKTDRPNCKLLMVLRSQPEYYMMNNQIKHLLE